MAFCSKCGTQLVKGVKFCPKCGQEIVKSQKNSKNHCTVTKVSNKNSRKIKDKDELSKSQKIALGIAGAVAFIGICGGTADGMWMVALISLGALGAVCAIFMGIIENKYAWATAICSIFAVLIAIGISNENGYKKFEAVEGGRAAYAIDSAHYEKSDVQCISKIIMYEGNSRKDCKAEGINGEGQLFTVDGKWEKKNLGNSSSYYYYLDYKYFKLLIREDSLICYYKGDNNDISSIEGACKNKIIGKVKDLSQEAENNISAATEKKKQEIEKERQAQLSKLLGNYHYSQYIGNTNAMLYFTITLKADGTFIHKPSNETTENMVAMYKVVDGYDYPDGGKWIMKETVAGKAIYLDFDNDWDGSIALENMVLEIKNMNGYNLKTKVRH